MKVVFCNNFFYIRGGSERVFFDEIEILKSYGNEVVPFSRHFEKNLSSEHSQFFASSIDYENVSLTKKILASFKLIYSFECKKEFSELLNYFQPDLIHAHNIYGRLTTSIIDAAKDKKISVVMTLHDYKLICPSYLMLLNGMICEKCRGKRFYNCMLTKCHKESRISSLIYTIESYFNSMLKKYEYVRYFICPSMFSLKKHVESGTPEKKLVHIPNFINIENFESNFENDGYILFVGRLSKEKGVLTLLNAVKGLDVSLKIVGDGPMRKEYEDFAKENSINNVSFEGYKSGDELKNIFRNSAFVVFPSEWYENAPMTILEAFAYGKPVIGSEIGGIPEMVIEGKTGLLFKPCDYNELKEKIKYLLSHPSLITEMGKNARKKVEEEYGSEVHYRKLIEVYKKAL